MRDRAIARQRLDESRSSPVAGGKDSGKASARQIQNCLCVSVDQAINRDVTELRLTSRPTINHNPPQRKILLVGGLFVCSRCSVGKEVVGPFFTLPAGQPRSVDSSAGDPDSPSGWPATFTLTRGFNWTQNSLLCSVRPRRTCTA